MYHQLVGMNYFKSSTHLFHISEQDAMERLHSITRIRFFERSKFHLFRGKITSNKLSLTPIHSSSILKINATIHVPSSTTVHLKLSGKFVWPTLIINITLLILSNVLLYYLSFLLFKVNMAYGICAGVLSISLNILLYFTLIGRIRKKYNAYVNSILNTLSFPSI